MHVIESGTPKKMSASGAVFSGPGSLLGFICTTAGDLSIETGTDGAGTEVVAPVTLAAGGFFLCPIAFASGCYANMSGGLVGTFIYKQ